MKRLLSETIGYTASGTHAAEKDPTLVQFINIKLAALDLPVFGDEKTYPFLEIGKSLLATYHAKDRLLGHHLCPVDQYVHEFICKYFEENGVNPKGRWLPSKTFTLERHGLARALSLPADGDEFSSDIITSYRTRHGVLHNPKSDRRTTKGVFHVCEGGLPIAWDKKAVPVATFSRLLHAAVNPPEASLELPFTSSQPEKAKTWVSLLLRPLLCPEVPGVSEEKRIEVRFFAPGSMVANLDFVESIFGNAGNPLLPENDARLDVEGWSGHTGCVILAPHLITLKKKELGLPHVSEATERQKRDGMCWEKEDEVYNDGTAFKVTCRDERGVVVTVIADNYFGYCKKEVKTQLSYAANLYGLVEEEHAGGAIAYPSFDLGEDFRLSQLRGEMTHTFDEVLKLNGDRMNRQPEGHGIDKQYPDIIYIPETAHFVLREQSISWERNGEKQQIKLKPWVSYVLPNGYKVQMINPFTGQRWRLIGTNPEGLLCHKPCTVSGGGKSEISKPITDAMVTAPVFTPNFQEDMDLVDKILNKDFSDRFKTPKEPGKPSRPILSAERSLGSVIRLLTPNPEYTEEYSAWLNAIPQRVKDLILTVKRFHRPHWGDSWRERFHVDMINGLPGFELRYRKRPVIAGYVRLGYAEDNSWRLFSLRKDFWPAVKLQREDDISVSVVVPGKKVSNLPAGFKSHSYKFIENCEFRLFQRPDDAIIPGYDKHTERDYARDGNFFSNYAPLTREDVQEMVNDVILFQQYTEDMQDSMRSFLADTEGPKFFVCNSRPRMVDGSPTKNPRYLQNRPDLGHERDEYLAELGTRLRRRLPESAPVYNPVAAVLPGRRNNPPQPELGIRPLAVYNPIHYQELPELFMDFIASLTGKSPSTTGAGSEGALTKGPFNMLLPVVDLNNALVSYLLTQSHGFTTAAGYVGHKYRVDHDISLLMPELWCRMRDNEQDPAWLIENGYLEKLEDFEHDGKPVLASRLGYRITENFARSIFGRVFSHPDLVLTEEMLKPELQSLEYFVDGISNIVEAQRKAAHNYFEDGGIDLAIPPLKALLHIMAHGDYEGKTLDDPEIRGMFTLEATLESDWYKARLEKRHGLEKDRLKLLIHSLEGMEKTQNGFEDDRLEVTKKISNLRNQLAKLEKDPAAAIGELHGTIGA
ncbi:MAG: hypothetical protein JJU29_13235 [Verrucomicrobia bacterium]|nr:hypothetical protein [Verrucomicrobiota bacterium]